MALQALRISAARNSTSRSLSTTGRPARTTMTARRGRPTSLPPRTTSRFDGHRPGSSSSDAADLTPGRHVQPGPGRQAGPAASPDGASAAGQRRAARRVAGAPAAPGAGPGADGCLPLGPRDINVRPGWCADGQVGAWLRVRACWPRAQPPWPARWTGPAARQQMRVGVLHLGANLTGTALYGTSLLAAGARAARAPRSPGSPWSAWVGCWVGTSRSARRAGRITPRRCRTWSSRSGMT